MSGVPPSTCPRCGARYPAGTLAFCPACLEQADLGPVRLGEALELIEPVGRGGMGTVWRARHLHLSRDVAVKFLAEELAAQPEFAARFEREAQALARLSHPGIVAVHDFGRDGDRPYIVMEYVPGQPLSALLPLPPERARTVALEVLAALAYAHAQGLVHRDVKPDNILVEDGGRVKVSDFGLARLSGAAPSGWTLTTAGRFVGTPAYMAPEAVTGGAPDPRMDVFSMGVVLYEMVTGHRPAGDFASLPDALDRVVRRALKPDPQQRYADAGEMRAALAAVGALDEAEELAPEERHFLLTVALLHTLATAAALWALLTSLTPRVLAPGDTGPLIMLGTERLDDGRLVSRARFETWPTLSAVALVGLALAAQGLLRRHWREGHLERAAPERAVPQSRTVLALGLTSLGLYAIRKLLEVARIATISAYVPIVGGLLELAAVLFVWTVVLEAWRTGRPLRREKRLWVGLALALVAPVTEMLLYLRAWRP
jgi:eukaryotic-like serine/threonine-protein kinase